MRALTGSVLTLLFALSAAPALATTPGTVSYDPGTHAATLVDGSADDLNVSLQFSSDTSGICTSGCDAFPILSNSPGGGLAAGPGCAVQNNTVVCPDTAANPTRTFTLTLDDGKDVVRVAGGSGTTSFCFDALTVDGGAGDDRIGASGTDTPSCPGYAEVATLRGGDGADRITGGPGDDHVYGDGGNDLLLRGDNGNDDVHGGDGDDLMGDFNYADADASDPGADTYTGDAGSDSVSYGGESAGVTVSLDGQANDGGPGESDNADAETVVGTAGNDTLTGDAAADTLRGQGGNDTLSGAGGDDRLIGDGGDDKLDGGPGKDSVFGDGEECSGAGCPVGNDTVEGADGEQDQVNCGPGADIAHLDKLDVVPAMSDFNVCESVTRSPASQPASPGLTVGKASIRKGLTITQACAAACQVSATVTVSKRDRRKRHLKSATVAKGSGSALTAGSVKLKLRFAKKVRRHLKHGLKATVHVKVTAADGTTATSAKPVTLSS